jgi:hypothetical protein
VSSRISGLFSVSGTRSDIRPVKSGMRPDTGFLKRADYPAGYPVHQWLKTCYGPSCLNTAQHRYLVYLVLNSSRFRIFARFILTSRCGAQNHKINMLQNPLPTPIVRLVTERAVPTRLRLEALPPPPAAAVGGFSSN